MSPQAAPPMSRREQRVELRSRQVVTSRRRLWTDAAARWSVTAGGLSIIAGILGILVFIVWEALPLVSGAEVVVRRELAIAPAAAAAVADEHRSHVATLAADGHLRVFDLELGATELDRQVVDATTLLAVATAPGQPLLTASTGDGRVLLQPVGWSVRFEENRRRVEASLDPPLVVELDPERRPLGPHAARLDAMGTLTAAAVIEDGSLALVRRDVTRNAFTGSTQESWARHAAPAPAGLSLILLDADQRNLYGATAAGELLWWRLADGAPGRPAVDASEPAAITAATLLIGDRSLVVGRADGSIAVWQVVPQEAGGFRLTRVRRFPSQGAAIRLLAPSTRDKGFLAQDAAGGLGLYHSTSGRTVWRGRAPLAGATALVFAPKADAALVAAAGRIVELELHNPHPEFGLGALFSRVWYEGYPRPAHVWQSSGGTDDFEPKLGLVPLMVGTLKGTFYSLLLAVPLGVLAGLYTAHFMHPALRRIVKPSVELMASLPSVVLGFLAGLWLAPRFGQVMPGLLLMIPVLPALVIAGGFGWKALPRAFRGRLPAGSEVLAYLAIVALGVAASLALGSAFEALAFGGDFQLWLLELTGLRYDQRNAVVVGVAMGFAVVPIIFSISEDAFSNVPQNLVSASLALGANSWQTARRVLVPTASPGIFAAVMIGFGRAVGETMIVLMATGNTPLLDWSPFVGFRTLSANIAVEIPEAPHGGTLYRTLFFSALLLFAFTFAANTVAEVVRQRLRERYAVR